MEISLENREKIIALLKEGTCPICGKEGIKNPLGHVSFVHKIPAKELKDRLLLGRTTNTFFAKENAQKQSNNAKRQGLRPVTYNRFKKHTDLAKQKISFANSKPVIRISPNGDVKLFKSVVAAAKECNITDAAIRACLYGRTKTSAGYRWKYLKEE